MSAGGVPNMTTSTPASKITEDPSKSIDHCNGDPKKIQKLLDQRAKASKERSSKGMEGFITDNSINFEGRKSSQPVNNFSETFDTL